MSNQEIVKKAVELRNKSSEFSGRASPDDIVEVLLEERLSELREADEKADEKQEELRAKWGLQSSEEASGGTQSEAEAKREELRERML